VEDLAAKAVAPKRPAYRSGLFTATTTDRVALSGCSKRGRRDRRQGRVDRGIAGLIRSGRTEKSVLTTLSILGQAELIESSSPKEGQRNACIHPTSVSKLYKASDERMSPRVIDDIAPDLQDVRYAPNSGHGFRSFLAVGARAVI
jgi:hypothetical protein